MIILPENKIFTQTNDELLSDLYTCFGMDFSNEYGKTKVSPRMILTTNNISNLGVAINFKIYNSKIWTVAGSFVFKTADTKTETAFVKDATSNSPTVCSSDTSDIETHGGNLWVATDNTLVYYDGSWHDAGGGGGNTITSGVFHKLISFRKQNLLYITDSVGIYSVSGTTLSKSGTNTFAFNTSQVGLNYTSLLQTDDYLWILIENSNGDTGYVILWDGVTANTATKIITLDSRGALTGIVKEGTPHIITVDGRLQSFNGGTFVDVKNGRLPIKKGAYLKNPFSSAIGKSDRWIHPNGICLKDGKINILINNEYYNSSASIDEKIASGVWEFDPNIGWYHKKPLTLFDISVGTVSDYGQNRISRAGALVNLSTDNNSADTYIGTLLAGGAYYSDASTTAYGIWTDDSIDTIQKYGYIVTKKLISPTIKDSFTKIWIIMKKLLSGNDKIFVKYRYENSTPTELTATWTSSTTFTTSTSLLGKEGYEVEGIQGAGSGYTAHITKIDVQGSTYTIAIDETLGASSGTAKVRVQNWKKHGVWSSQTTLAEFGSMGTYPWIQLKLCFLFTGDDQIYKVVIENVPSVQIANYSYK